MRESRPSGLTSGMWKRKLSEFTAPHLDSTPELRGLKSTASVPGRCLVYRDERFPTGACDANRSRTARLSPRGDSAKGREANVRPKEHKWAERQDVGGECASDHEAQESLTACCRAQRRERKEQTLTRGDPGVERLREVSRGHSSVRGTHERKGVSSEGPKDDGARRRSLE